MMCTMESLLEKLNENENAKTDRDPLDHGLSFTCFLFEFYMQFLCAFL